MLIREGRRRYVLLSSWAKRNLPVGMKGFVKIDLCRASDRVLEGSDR